ncbi:hypothetical protein CHUAL_011634 [Chamberlinius hualienensis]
MISKLRARFVILVTLSVIAYNEWLSYTLSKFDWAQLPNISPHGKSEVVRLLFVADPQIQGYHYEPAGLVGAITRWDSDRYLEKSFTSALSFSKPDVVLFLGDHMDEGSIASDAHFVEYKSRFFKLFPIPEGVKVVSIPGDNDIGGEGVDRITKEKSQRFDDTFGKEIYVQYKFLEFVKVNLLTKVFNFSSLPPKSENKLRIILTHIPLLPSYESLATTVITELNPDLVISAHEHLARLMDRNPVGIQTMDTMEQKGRIWKINCRGQNLFEIMVPTCSYRMGVPRSGYGAAVIDSSGNAHYTVLWLPQRFPQLFVYILTLALVAFLTLPFGLYHCWTTVSAFVGKRKTKYITV